MGERHGISMLFPAQDDDYRAQLENQLGSGDEILGRLSRERMYAVLREAVLVVSIPMSDSSPRSVYEAVFAGACVAVAPAGYLDELPACMKQRMIVTDLDDSKWLEQAYAKALEIVKHPYRPSAEALEMCDRERLSSNLIKDVYAER